VKPKTIFNWSGGKDSALCLHKVLQAGEHDILCLLTSLSEQHQRISMHGVRAELLEAQAAQLGIPLVKLSIPEAATMEAYEAVMTKHLKELVAAGATHSMFGDIFLEDLRTYREEQLAKMGLTGVFPLWKIPTGDLIREFIDAGFKTVVTCVNEKFLDRSFAGRIIDHAFLRDLPANVDPCGENGEFHTFVFDGPLFREAIPFERGEIVYRKYARPQDENATDCFRKNASPDDCFKKEEDRDDPYAHGFWYCDLLPAAVAAPVAG
jgi:uncharacterized protein (TIGR00290 family)